MERGTGLILSPKPFLETIPSPSNPKLKITVLLCDVTYLDAMASRKKKISTKFAAKVAKWCPVVGGLEEKAFYFTWHLTFGKK